MVKAFNKVPGPVSLPVVGTLYLYKLGIFNYLKYHKVLDHLFKTYGPLVREKFGSSTVVHVFDPDDTKTIYQNEGKWPYIAPLLEAGQLYRQKIDLSPGLGNVNGEEWYRLRAAVRHLMLKPKDVHQFLPAVHGVARDLIKRFQQIRDKQGFVSDLATEIGKWSQESMGVVCFDKRLGYLGEGVQQAVIEEVIQANRTLLHFSTSLKFSLPIYKYVPTPKWRKVVEAENILLSTSTNYTTEAIESVESLVQSNQLTSDRYSFILSLLSKPQLSRKDVDALTFSLFSDGLFTTVPTVLHSLYCLATNPEVQEKVYEEGQRVIGMSDEITTAHLSQLNYLKAVVKETLRMYPNGTEVSRIPQEDIILSDYHVPAKTILSINMGVHFRSEKYFTSPELFMPERWLRGGAADSVHPYVFTPFGFGTRTCIGKRFAEQDMYVLLSEIVRNFRMTYESNQPLELMFQALLMPAHPLPIRFIPRQH